MAGEQVFVATPTISGGRANIIASPFQWLFTGEDHLRLVIANALAGVVVRWQGRFMRKDGTVVPIQGQMTPTSDRALNVALVPMEPGFLLNFAVGVTNAAPTIGQVFVQVNIVRGLAASLIVLGQILGGYCTVSQLLAYPGSPIVASTEGLGALRLIVGTDPAAGVDWSETVPTNARWQLLSVRALFQTDATVAARNVNLLIDDGTNNYYRIASHRDQPASQPYSYSWSVGTQDLGGLANAAVVIPLPNHAYMKAGYRVRAATSLMQAGDDWSTLSILAREWLEA